MGCGDILMSMGEARALHARVGKPVLICDRYGRSVRSDLLTGVPYILSKPLPDPAAFERLANHPGRRPYIQAKLPDRWVWQAYRPIPAELRFTHAEQVFGERGKGFVLVEPNGKAIGHDNKLWPKERWLEFAAKCPYPLIQASMPGTWRLPGITTVECGFREVLALLANCRAFVGPEGGLMHGAAAVGTPAVVLWSHFIEPKITGYAHMTNLRHAGPACGSRTDCPECRASLQRITVGEVLAALTEILK